MNKKIILIIVAIVAPLIVGWAVWTTNNVYSFQKTEYNQLKIEIKINKLADKIDSGFTKLNEKIDSYTARNNEQIIELWKKKKEYID